ncbi:MAG TPA: SIMPL domain-containing protein [Pirellulales bacterium]|nr:SIMPL domain-containing protein [Pirellulales bacterium]
MASLPTAFRLLPFAFCLYFAFCVLPLFAAADDEPGITVTGAGEARARPDCLEFDVQAAGAAELSGDAIVKFHERLRRVTDAFQKLGISQLRLEERDLSISDVANEQNPRPHVTIARALRIVITDIHKLPEDDLLSLVGKVMDTAKDMSAGSEQAQQGAVAVRFALGDPKAVRAEACKRAFADAREEGQRLAQLAGGRLGRALSVQDVSSTTTNTTVQETIYAIYGAQLPQPEEPGRIVSNSLKDIPVRVSLRVRFELLESPDQASKTVVEK